MKRLSYVAGFGLLLFCLLPGVFAADGFGANTTGGEGGITPIVDSAVDFKELVETVGVPYVVRVSGVIDLGSVGGKVSIRSNKTIQGVDPNATIKGEFGFKKALPTSLSSGLTSPILATTAKVTASA